MSQKELSRRDFLLRTSALGAVALGSGAILSACGGGQEQQMQGAAEEAEPMAEPAESMAEPMADACDDLSGLADADVQMRQTLQYVGETPNPEQTCDNCQLYVVPEGDAACGGCQIIKGPISPNGYCTSWAQKVS